MGNENCKTNENIKKTYRKTIIVGKPLTGSFSDESQSGSFETASGFLQPLINSFLPSGNWYFYFTLSQYYFWVAREKGNACCVRKF